MAGGPISYNSSVPWDLSGSLFPLLFTGSGGNASWIEEGLGVASGRDHSGTWMLRFPMPPSIPTGTFKFSVNSLAHANSGTVNFTLYSAIACPASGDIPSKLTLTAEAAQTATWGLSGIDAYVLTKFPISGSTPLANSVLVGQMLFTSGTLAANSIHQPTVLWE